MKQARKIAVARAFRPDAVTARAICSEQFRDAAGQRLSGGDADLDAQLVGLVRLALGDAFDLGGVQL